MGAPRGVEILDNSFTGAPELIAHLDGLGRWSPSTVGGDSHEASFRTSSTCFVPFISYTNPPIIERFARTVWQLLDNYAASYGVAYHQIEPITFNRYEPGQMFGAHSDHLRGSERVFSAVAYLNTVHDGGGTRFIHYEYEVSAVEGRVVIFPSNYLFAHEGVAPANSTKYSAAFWVRG